MNIFDTETQLDLTNYYDERYQCGYMDKWDDIKIDIVRSLLMNIKLVKKPTVIDYGCGSGFFTRIIKEEFPEARVIGTDISSIALDSANNLSKNIEYYLLSNIGDHVNNAACNFIFSHHVLEHVSDLEDVASHMQQLLAPGGVMLHVLPCGNAGSFEYKICQTYDGGIDSSKGNRFFFEDPSHLRRLSTPDMVSLFGKQDLSISMEYYANQYWGSLRWITDASPAVIKDIFAPRRVRGRQKFVVAAYRYMALAVRQARFSRTFDWRLTIQKLLTQRTWLGRGRGGLHFAVGIVFYIPSKIVDRICFNMAWKEWEQRKTDPQGSEMFLMFRKNCVTSGSEGPSGKVLSEGGRL